MGLFSPKWMTDKPGKQRSAIEAVRQVRDQEQLYEISRQAPLEEVRAAAVRGITDTRLQKRILEDSSDQKILYALLMETRPEKASMAFISRDTVSKAVSRIDDQQLLENLIKKGHSPAVFRLKNKEAHYRIISDPMFFAGSGLGAEEVHSIIWNAAVTTRPFTEKDEIIRAARCTCDQDVASHMVQEIIRNGWMTAEGIAVDDAFGTRARIAAIQVISDQEVLKHILTLDTNILIESAAKKRIDDPEIKRELCGKGMHEWVCIRNEKEETGEHLYRTRYLKCRHCGAEKTETESSAL